MSTNIGKIINIKLKIIDINKFTIITGEETSMYFKLIKQLIAIYKYPSIKNLKRSEIHALKLLLTYQKKNNGFY